MKKTVRIRTGAIVAAGAMIVAVVGGIVGSAVASHQFADVGNGSFFHDSIGAITGSGCATGFPDGSFRPNTNASRGQFAYWMHNCGGRVDYSEVGGTTPSSSTKVTSVHMFAGAKASTFATSGFALITADYELTGFEPAGCNVVFLLARAGTLLEETRLYLGPHTGAESASTTQLVAVSGGTSALADVFLSEEGDTCGSSNPLYEVSLSSVYIPFDGEGNGGSEASPVELAPEPQTGDAPL